MKQTFLLTTLVLFGIALNANSQTITITSDNAYAYGAENHLSLETGSRVIIHYSYRKDGTTLKAALLDFIDVVPTAEGTAEPWVSIQLHGNGSSDTAGLDNDVDFTGQPYLWLSSNNRGSSWESTRYNTLNGIYTPEGDTYRLGYGGLSWTGESGILVTNLTDNALTGAKRSVIVRGTGVTTLRKLSGSTISFTGPLVVDGSDLSFAAGDGFYSASSLILTNNARLVVKSTNASLPAKLPVVIGGEATLYVSGGGATPHFTINGDVSGSGTIHSTDSGAIWFYGTNNTFTGILDIQSSNASKQTTIGGGSNFSWSGSGFSGTLHCLILNCNNEATFTAPLPTTGRIVKRGSGRLTLGSVLNRSGTVQNSPYAIEIEGGTLVRGIAETTPMSGLVSLSNGATFDLGGIAAETCYLPVGNGSVTNAANDTVRFSASPTNNVSFLGYLPRNVEVNLASEFSWSLSNLVYREPVLTGDLTCNAGTVVLDANVVTGRVCVAKGAKVLFSAEAYNRRKNMTGLAVDFWKNVTKVSNKISDFHKLYRDNCLEAIAKRTPDVRTDMSKFTLGLRSGDTAAGSTSADPFCQILGGSLDYFAAMFSGYFYAKTAGAYTFRIYADDSSILWIDGTAVLKPAYGSSDVGFNGTIVLSEGWHSFRTIFGEEGGWEVFIVHVKRPGESDFSEIKMEELTATRGEDHHFGALVGSGSIGLATDGRWPAIDDTSAFTGKVIVNADTAGDVGTLPLNSATLSWEYGEGWTPEFWTTSELARKTTVNEDFVVQLLPTNMSRSGILNSTDKVRITGPWSFSFDYRVVPPYIPQGMGDGLFVGLHGESATSWSDQGREGATTRLTMPSAYGFQTAFYRRGDCEYCWVKSNLYYEAALPMTTNKTFYLANLKEDPVRMTLSYDGVENLIMTLSRREVTLAYTNRFAKTDLEQLYPSGTARLAVWGKNGYYAAATRMENIIFESNGTETPTLGGTIELRGGAIAAKGTGVAELHLSANLVVKGETDWTNSSAINLASPLWTFDLSDAATLLRLSGSLVATGDIAVDFTNANPWPDAPRLVADLSGAEGTLPTFKKAETLSKWIELPWEESRLSVWRSKGLRIIVR